VADQQDEKHPYKSRFAVNLWVRPEQYLAENMVARLATRDKYQLPDRFWAKSDRWGREFKRQAMEAATLLKEFSIQALIAALNTTRGKQMYSFGAKKTLLPLIRDEQRRIDDRRAAAAIRAAAEPKPEAPAETPKDVGPRPTQGRPNTLDKLRD
jgi:hypothetical protein